MQRNTYTKKHDGLFSVQNEPVYLNNNYIEYPDMKQAYDKFEKFIGHDNFILTSGTETAVRIALQALNPNLFSIEYPSWQMPKVIASALDINTEYYDYFIEDGLVKPGLPIGDVIYHTHRQNNLFEHEPVIVKSFQYEIIDMCYTLDLNFIKEKSNTQQSFLCGSFSKIFGPGIRLGFLVYPKQFHNKIQMLREQYINSLAYNYLMDLKEWPTFNYKNPYQDAEKPPLWIHDTYATFDYFPKQICNDPKEYKIFKFDNQIFYRLGRNKNNPS